MERSEIGRKLAAILSADVVGYSRLMQVDDQATLRALTERRALFAERVSGHGGRIVNAPGDSILAEFASVMNAVECAVEVQRLLAESNLGLPERRRMQFRIGVNLGDVLVDAGGIYGDGVNIAARLEALSAPGGICVSRPVHDEVKNRLALEFEDLGEQAVKNIAEPVRVFRIVLENRAGCMRILVVDDHPLIPEALGVVLGALGSNCMVEGAGELDAGLARSGAEPRPDLVLLDLGLPGYSGLAALERFRAERPEMPVVVLSADAARERVMASIDLGAMGFIPKSARKDVLLAALRLVIAGGIYVPPDVMRYETAPAPSASAAGGTTDAAARTPRDLGLTGRQSEVLGLLLRGLPNKLICRELDLAEGTVKIHISAILRALGVANRTQAVLAANRLGLRLEPRATRAG